MQKLWLKNFEFHINPGTWNTAQDLLQASAVQHLKEIEKHFWVADVRDGEDQYEIELMITPHKIKAFTCECWTEGRQLICPHIAAGLFRVRQFLEHQTTARQNRKAAAKKTDINRITTSQVLANVSPEELSTFVRNYAQQDRDFALSMKTWFAGKLDHADNPYSLVLDSAIPKGAFTRPLREPELRRLRKTLENLITQVDRADLEANAAVVYQITTAVLQKVSPLLPKLDNNRQHNIREYCHKAIEHLLGLSPDHLSPELRENRDNFCLDLILQENLDTDIETALISYLSNAGTKAQVYKRIQSIFEQHPFPAPTALLHLFLSTLAKRDMDKAVVRVLQDYTERPALIKKAILYLHYQNCWSAVLQSGEYFLDKQLFNAGQRRAIEDLLLLAAQKTKDKPRQLRYLRQRYLEYGSEELFTELKTTAGTGWPKERDLLLQALDSEKDIDKIALVLSKEEQGERLVELIRGKQDLVLMQQYEQALLPEHQTFVRDFYLQILSKHLEEHFGAQATQYVREQLVSLPQNGHGALAREIVQSLISQYPDRKSLQDILKDLQPKKHQFALPVN